MDWSTCNRYHKLKHVDQLYPKSSFEYGAFGTAVHNVIQKFFPLYATEVIDFDEVDKFFSANFEEELVTAIERNPGIEMREALVIKQEQDTLGTFEHIFSELHAFFKGKEYEVIGIEDKILHPLNIFYGGEQVFFRGYVDMIIKSGGKYFIWDFKTTTNGWYQKMRRSDKVKYQLALYKKSLAEREGWTMKQIRTQYILIKQNCKTIDDKVEFLPSSCGPKTSKRLDGLLNKAITAIGISNKLVIPNFSGCREVFGTCPFKGTELCKNSDPLTLKEKRES